MRAAPEHWHPTWVVHRDLESHEIWRNNTIEELQGTRNPFIDHPKQVEDLEF